MSDMVIEGIIVFLILLIIVVSLTLGIAAVSAIDSKLELHKECLSEPRYDKFQCHSMIYGGVR